MDRHSFGNRIARAIAICCSSFTNLLQITLFLTPIFSSLDQMTGRAVLFAQLNPLFHLVEIVREPMLGIAPSPLHWLIVLGITAVGWTLAIQLLARFRHRIVYWI